MEISQLEIKKTILSQNPVKKQKKKTFKIKIKKNKN